MVLRRILGVARLARRAEEIGLRRSHDDVAAAAGQDRADKKTTTGGRCGRPQLFCTVDAPMHEQHTAHRFELHAHKYVVFFFLLI